MPYKDNSIAEALLVVLRVESRASRRAPPSRPCTSNAQVRRVASLRREIRGDSRKWQRGPEESGLHDGAAEGLPGEEQHWATIGISPKICPAVSTNSALCWLCYAGPGRFWLVAAPIPSVLMLTRHARM